MRLNEIKNEDDEDLKFRPTISEKSWQIVNRINTWQKAQFEKPNYVFDSLY
jgi:hypothetical protein